MTLEEMVNKSMLEEEEKILDILMQISDSLK